MAMIHYATESMAYMVSGTMDRQANSMPQLLFYLVTASFYFFINLGIEIRIF
jgi:hypothetical protein